MDYKKIKTFEDACKDQGINAAFVLPDVSMLPTGMQKFLTAAYKLSVIGVSLNKDKKGNVTKADWNDTDEAKWFPWMRVQADDDHPSGSGLSFDVTACVLSRTNVASRLTSRKSEIAKYFFDQFKDLWEDYILERETNKAA